MIIKLQKDKINQMEFPLLKPWMNHGRYVYLFAEAGRDHYRLLSYISSLYDNATISDVGTKHGLSAIALATATNHVCSYDLIDKLDDQIKNESEDINCRFFVEDCLENEEHKKRILESDIIMLDTDHDGIFETQFYECLCENDYTGLLILDDINLCDPMINFWNMIHHTKYDVTEYGHGISGTGIVCFGEQTVIKTPESKWTYNS